MGDTGKEKIQREFRREIYVERIYKGDIGGEEIKEKYRKSGDKGEIHVDREYRGYVL